LVAFPTDTLYALGADAFNPIAVERIFAAKGRRWSDPIPLLVCDLAMALQLTSDLPEVAAPLIESYWPGPLTLLIWAAPNVSRLLTAGTTKIGVRLPGASLARELILRLGRPVTGTSANRSGGKDPRDANEVYRQLRYRVDLILDGGPASLGTPSTVVDLTMTPPHIVREGAVDRAGILSLLTAWFRLPSEERAWRARSMKAFGK
jgi:L-threonylcarbamoyladenylate synthase